MDIKHKIL